MTTTKEQALARHLGIDADDVTEALYGDNRYNAGGLGEWLIFTDGEADAAARAYIADSLWSFRSDFLAGYVVAGIDAQTLRTFQETKYEDSNDAIRALIDAGPSDFDSFVTDAVSADGRGNFLAFYDGEEIELDVDGETHYAYRVD